jgi:hypothetical protein
MQNVQLPTNQSSYKTPSMTSAAPGVAEKKQQMNPQKMAATGGLLGKIGKGAWDAFNRPESMALDKASSANLGQLGGLMGLLQGSNVDAAANMAGQTAGNLANLPQPSMLGAGVPAVGEWADAANSVGKIGGAVPELGNLSTVNDAVANATDAANAATDVAGSSSYSLPGVGTALGVGLNLAQGNYGKAAGQAAGAAVGSAFGPLGTAAGGLLGGFAGDMFNRWL